LEKLPSLPRRKRRRGDFAKGVEIGSFFNRFARGPVDNRGGDKSFRISGSPETVVSNHLSARNIFDYRIASLTGFPTRLSISTSVSIVNLAVFLFTTSETRGRETIRISAAWACFK